MGGPKENSRNSPGNLPDLKLPDDYENTDQGSDTITVDSFQL